MVARRFSNYKASGKQCACYARYAKFERGVIVSQPLTRRRLVGRYFDRTRK
jgi:hypothetical protein